MKSSEQMVQSLFQRREQYSHRQKIRRNVITGVATAVIFCLCGVTAWGISREPGGVTEQPPVQLEEPVLTEGPEKILLAHKIVITPLESIPSASIMGIARMRDDFVEMSVEEMKAYYGRDYFPDVPDDLQMQKHNPGIFKRHGGTGETYWDEDEFRYFNADQSRDVSFRVAKGKIPFVDFNVFDGTKEKSNISGVEIPIGMTAIGAYYTEFVYDGVGFMIYAEGLTEMEFVNMLASLLD